MTKKNTPQPYLFVKQLMLTLPLLGLFLLSTSNVSGQITTDVTSCVGNGIGNATLMPAGMMNGKPSYSCTQCVGIGSVCDVLVSWSGTQWEYNVACNGGAFPGVVATNMTDSPEPPCAADFPWMDAALGCIDGDVTIAGASCTAACPKIEPAITAQEICSGAEPDFATAEGEIDINATATSIGAYTYFLDAAFTMAYTAGSLTNLTCEPITLTLYGRLQCTDTDAAGTADEFDDFQFDITVYPNANNYTVTETAGDCGTAAAVSITAENGDECFAMMGTAPTDPGCGNPDDVQDITYSFDPGLPTACNATFGNTVPASCMTVSDDPQCMTQDITLTVDPTTGSATIAAADVDNGSMAAAGCEGTLSLSIDPTTFTCDDIGPNTVTLTITDGNGNSSTCTATVTVMPCTDPSFDCPPTQTSCNGDPFNLNPVEPGGTYGGTAGPFVMNDVLDPTGMPAGSYTLTYTVNGVTSEVCEFTVVLPPKSANAGSLGN